MSGIGEREKMEKLEELFVAALVDVGVDESDRAVILRYLSILRDKGEIHQQHYAHSLRVGMKSREIARFVHHEERPLLIAGAFHDIGKCHISCVTLARTEVWTADDQDAIEQHVMQGHTLLRDRFDLSAEILVWHHRFQYHGYPKQMPDHLHGYAETTKLLIAEYGRIVALADVYDALGRVNSSSGGVRLSGQEIRRQMHELNRDRRRLIDALYDGRVFSENDRRE